MQSYYHSRIKDMNSVLIIGQPRFIFNHDPELSEREIIGTPWIGDTIRDFFKWIKSLFSKKTEDVAPTIEPPKETIKKFSSFSGCDIVVYKDGNVVGEIESISWYNPTQLEREQLHKSDYYDTDLAEERPVIIKITMCLFGGINTPDFNDCEIRILMQNEFGEAMHRTIEGASELFENSGAHVDSIMTNRTVYLAAKSMTKWEPGKE